MSEIFEQQEKEESAKYYEFERPLTKEEKEDVRYMNIENPKLSDRFCMDCFYILPILCCAAAVGSVGIAIAQSATGIGGALLSAVVTTGGVCGGLLYTGKTVVDACRYFSDRSRRIHEFEQEKIKENTEQESRELYEVRQQKLHEAQKLQEKFNAGLTAVVERRKEEIEKGALQKKLPQIGRRAKKRTPSATKKTPFTKRQQPQAGD